MLPKDITYITFDDEEVTETFYFHFSKPELIEMETQHAGGFSAMLQRVVDEKDNHKLILRFKEIILKSYGVKSDDGRRFIKTQQLSDEFAQTPAFEVLFMELAEVDNAAANFMIGVLPRDMQRNAQIDLNKTAVAAVPSKPKAAPTKRTNGTTGAKR